MITKDVARLIYNCYSEIENSEKMIEELKNRINDKGELQLQDSWSGQKQTIQLHVPHERGSYGIHQVPFHLALDVIQEHIGNQRKELERLKEVCKIQLA